MALNESRGGPSNDIFLQRIRIDQIVLAADAANRVVVIADAPCELVGVMEAHSVVGGASFALQVEKLTGTTAPGSGTAMLAATVDLTTTINTVATPALTTTLANRRLAVGDRVGFRLTGTAGSFVGCVALILKRVD
jgi:hypothetical protein